ncbi:fibronectin type III domain-containing protein [Silvanigrella sp.]|uniref:fibronectin type III domain-containing protein n=1 Tax=Silvanigrella sp. TaxID=2024976 RepID=UPI0037C70ECC
MNCFKGFLYKISIIFLISLSLIDDISNAAEKNYLIYNVKKHDTIYKILKKYKLFPIFGKKGYLKKTLELNPSKKKTKGNLIYPREKIKIPIYINGKSTKLPTKTVQQKNEDLQPQPPPPEVKPTIELKSELDSRDVVLNWEVKDQQQTLSFEVQRSLFSATQYRILSQNINANEFKDTDLILNNTYYYIVNGVDNTGKTITSNEVSILYSPIFFKSLTGKLNEKKIELKWEEYDKKNKVTYEVKRAIIKDEEYKIIAENLESLNFTDESIAPNKIYNYIITVKSLGVEIANSNEISVTSFKGFDIPSAFKYSLGTSYLSYHEYNTQNNTDVVLNSSVSPSFDFKYSLDWTKEFLHTLH